jgi:hypothetical protein
MFENINQNSNIVLFVVIVVNLVLFIWLLVWRFKLQALLKGKNGTDLEKVILNQDREIKRLKSQVEVLTQTAEVLTGHAANSIQKVGMVKFNPFNEASANQSFTVAMLNHKNDGFLLSSLASRDGTRLYAKEISAGRTKYNLSEEEQRALTQALREKSKSTKKK